MGKTQISPDPFGGFGALFWPVFAGSMRAAGCLALFLLGLVTVVAAQTPATLLVTYPQVVEEGETLRLNVYFTVVNEGNRAVSNADVDRAGIIRIAGKDKDYEADITPAESPLYIALVLDASGSMSEAIGDLRQAALAAVESAPPQAHLAVYQFNEPDPSGRTLQPLHDFGSDREAIRQSINLIQSANAGTCIYYAANEAVEAVGRAAQDSLTARRAVILFTDGYDELTTGQRDTCSRNTTVEQVITAAKVAGPTPIYTIGMAGRNPVDEFTLRRFADETGGLSVVGGRVDLPAQFQQMMEILAEQWVATTLVASPAGPQQATLAVRYSPASGGAVTDLAGDFTFESPRDFFDDDLPIYRVGWLDAENRFRIDVGNPQAISRLELILLKEEGGEVETLRIEPVTGSGAYFAAPQLDRLESGRRYRVQVYAFDQTGTPILRDDDPVLATADFTYEPPTPDLPAAPVVRIVEVIPDPGSQTMIINLDAQNIDQVDRYRVSLYNESLQTAVPSFTVFPNESGRLVVDLSLIDADPGLYQVAIMPLDGAQKTMLEEDISYPHQVAYIPDDPSLMERLGLSFRQHPWIPLLIGLLLVALVFFFIFVYLHNREPKSGLIFEIDKKKSEPKSPLNPPSIINGGQPDPKPQRPREPRPIAKQPIAHDRPVTKPQVTITVDESPDARSRGRSLRIVDFPFQIGREQAQLNIADPRISRVHLTVLLVDERVYVIDNSSRNGSVLGESLQKLEPKRKYELRRGRTQIRMGATTISIVY